MFLLIILSCVCGCFSQENNVKQFNELKSAIEHADFNLFEALYDEEIGFDREELNQLIGNELEKKEKNKAKFIQGVQLFSLATFIFSFESYVSSCMIKADTCEMNPATISNFQFAGIAGFGGIVNFFEHMYTKRNIKELTKIKEIMDQNKKC